MSMIGTASGFSTTFCGRIKRKGYAFVGSNSAGNNAYFVRRDRLGDIRELSAREAYVESKRLSGTTKSVRWKSCGPRCSSKQACSSGSKILDAIRTEGRDGP